MPTKNMDLKLLASSLERIMKEAGKLATPFNRNKEQIEVKGLNSLVTEIDRNMEIFLVQRLGDLLPDSGFQAEEGTSEKKGKDYNWIIDPLDGTTNFIHGIPAYCCSIALLLENEIVLSGILELNTGNYFSAIRDKGAFLNGIKLEVSSTQLLSDSLIATGFPYYDFEYLDEYMNLFRELMKDTRGIRRLGSAALDLAYVACGRFDAFFEYGLHPWDVAAGVLLIEEAGGKVTDFKGGSNHLYGRQILASNNFVHPELLSKVKGHFKH